MINDLKPIGAIDKMEANRFSNKIRTHVNSTNLPPKDIENGGIHRGNINLTSMMEYDNKVNKLQ